MELFGYLINKKKDDKEEEKLESFIAPSQDDGSIEVAAGGAYGTFLDMEGRAKSDGELVSRYRNLATQPEADLAIQDIINESIVQMDDGVVVTLVMDKLKVSESVKTKIREEFNGVLKLLKFDNNAYDIFKKWYVDGRLFYHAVIDKDNPKMGIRDLRNIDPRKIRKIRQPIKDKDPRTGAIIYKGAREYYIYNPKGLNDANINQGIRIAKDAVIYAHSGILDNNNNLVYSHLHKAVKPHNQLRMLEDAVVIYRLARAPERRIFYIDVGNLPKLKAEQYLRDMMVKHKNKLIYDATTGEVRDDRRYMTMLEDFWLPRREGGRGTEITTLPGGQNLGEMDDVEYFKRKLYKSLNVPITRMESENAFNLGRPSEITRDEVKFSKFIKRLRSRFSMLFDEILEINLALKGIATREDWQEMKQFIYFDFNEDNHYQEIKHTEILRDRMQMLQDVDQYEGKYFSKEWIRREILHQKEDEILEIDKQIEAEAPEEEEEGPPEDGQEPKGPPQKAEKSPSVKRGAPTADKPVKENNDYINNSSI